MTRKQSTGPITAGELMAKLRDDPAYQAQMRERALFAQQRAQAYRAAVEPLIAALRVAGCSVESLEELRKIGAKGGKDYRTAIPILLRWLPETSNQALKSDIVRTLTLPAARPDAARGLVDEFKRTEDTRETGLRGTIANALAVVADDSVFEDLVTLVQDKSYGRAREMLALAVGTTGNSNAATVLNSLLDDEVVVGHALMALRKLKAPVRADRIEQLLQHPQAWIRKEAKRAVAKGNGP
jgi:hypothetical protein